MSSINLEMNDLEGEKETKLPHFLSRMYVLLPSKYLFLEPEKRKRARRLASNPAAAWYPFGAGKH